MDKITLEEMQHDLKLTELDIEDLSEVVTHLRAFIRDERKEPRRKMMFSADILRFDFQLSEAYRLKLAIEKTIKQELSK